MKKILILIAFVVAIVLVKVFELDAIFSFENLKNSQENLSVFVQDNYILTAVIFISLYIVSVAIMIPIATILTLAGGFLFGSIIGVVFVNIGATLGAILAFLFARYIIGNKIQEQYKDQLEKFNKELEENKYQYLFSLRFLPIFPFFLVNSFCGVTNVDLRTFFITTSLGIIPGSFVYTFAGSQLANINSLNDIFTTDILIAFILLGLLSLVPVIVKKYKAMRA
jgi:uncharacterized membrane protein YdjX (TVP38/TMEM64 family)